MFEQTVEFVAKVKYLAEDALRGLERTACAQGEEVFVRYVDANGFVRGIVWDVSAVRDRRGRRACDFLHDGVMQGTSLSYTDESAVRHFAFINEDIRGLLKKNLVKDMMCDCHLKPFHTMSRLQKKDVESMPHMSWTVVPQGMLKCGSVPHTWSLTFSGVTLEGLPLHNQSFFANEVVFKGYLLPRNYLWALDYEALFRKMAKKGIYFWYNAHERSARMSWDR